jgi:hypothetical protein
MRRMHRAALVVSLLLAPPAALGAQEAGAHRGFYLGAGIGHGSAQLTCAICQGGRDGGTSGYLGTGYSVASRVRLGAEVLAWYKGGQVDYLLTSLQLVAVLYPIPRNRLFIKTGFGVAKYAAEDDDDSVKTQAFAGQVGIGYEVPMGRGLSLVPFANFLGTTGGDVRFNDTVSDLSANTSLIQVGIGVGLN